MRSLVLLLLILGTVIAGEYTSTVGREGSIRVVLPHANLEAVPVDDPRTAFIVRIANREKVSDGTRYDLRWIGAVPGSYNLIHYLIDRDGNSLSELKPITVEIHSVLPPGMPGDLITDPLPPTPRLDGYQIMMIILGVVWLLILPFLIRRKSRTIIESKTIAPPSIADQLRDIISQASKQPLNTETQAKLERLLLGHWRERLQIQHLDAPVALQHLRDHAEAGILLRQLEAWLHAPPGRTSVDVTALLAPYLHVDNNPAAVRS